jgi:hypothetical protein
MNGESPATKRDLAEFEARLTTGINSLEVRFTHAVREALEEMETKLLHAFFHYSEQADLEMRKLEADVSNIDTVTEEQVNRLEMRIFEIERKVILNPPPPPQP